jgi:hypothetical protein
MTEPHTQDRQAQDQHVQASGLLARVADWWRRRGELAALPPEEVERMAHDAGLTAGDLRALAARGSGAADLLYERMAVLGLAREDVQRLAPGLMRDLEASCSCCGNKEQCERDLSHHPEDGKWSSYCPNATSLESVQRTKGRALI